MASTEPSVEDRIDTWHDGAGEGQELHEYLGWSWEDYRAYAEKGVEPPAVIGVAHCAAPDCERTSRG